MRFYKEMVHKTYFNFNSGALKLVVVIMILTTFSSCGIFNKNRKNDGEDPRIKDFNFNYHFLEANKQKALGNFEEALREYSAAYKVDNSQASVCYEIAGLLSITGDNGGAVEYAEKAVALDKTDNEFYRLLLAYIYQNNSQNDKAAGVYKSLIKSFPEKVNYYFELSSIYVSAESFKDAIRVLNEAEAKFGVTEMISLEKESLFHKAGMKDEAISEIEKLVENYPQNTKYLTLLAESYVSAGEYRKAEEVYATINLENVSDGIVFFSMAEFYKTSRDYEKSFQCLELGIQRDDVNLDLKVRMMLQYLEIMGSDKFMIGKIKDLLEQLKEKYPKEIKIRALTSDFYLFTQDYEAAQEEFDYLLSEDKSKFKIWEQALQIDFLLNDMESMYKRSKEATELYPNVIELYRYLIISSYATERFKDVAESVDYVSGFLTNDQALLIEFLTLQGDAYHKLNQHHESDSVYELVLYKDSENLPVLNNYAYFLSERNEKLDRALEMSTRLVELEGDNPVYLDTHAWVLLKNGDYKNALSFIKKAIDLDKENYVYLDHQGDILFMMGKIDEAVESWKQSVENGNISQDIEEKITNKKIVE